MTKLSNIMFFLFLVKFSFAQPGDMPPNAEPGKCYAKCLISSEPETKVISVNIYVGNDDVELKYVKRKNIVHRSNYLLAELVNKMRVEIDNPEELMNQLIVKRPKKVDPKNIEVREFEVLKYESSNYTEWREVVCNGQSNEELIRRIALGLKSFGIEVLEDQKFDEDFKKKLTQFQRENGLPIGQIDKETLNVLKIRI